MHTNHSTGSQTAAHQGHSAYTTWPTQGYARPPRQMGKTARGPINSLLLSSIPRLRSWITATYRKTKSIQLPTDSLPLVILPQPPPNAYNQPVQGYTQCWYLTHHHSYSHWHSHPACLPSLWASASSHHPCKTTGW